jgi:hypothetical protein
VCHKLEVVHAVRQRAIFVVAVTVDPVQTCPKIALVFIEGDAGLRALVILSVGQFVQSRSQIHASKLPAFEAAH